MDLAALQNTITALQQEVAYLRQLFGTRGTSRPKPVLPDPEKFSNASQYYTWLPLIKAKLRIDAEAIGNDEAQFFYLYGNLDSRVQSIVLPHLATAEDNGVWDYKTILDQLDRVYNDPNKKDGAATRLQSVKQGSDSVSVFLAKFERLLHEAGANSWPAATKISILRNGVNDRLKAKLDVQLQLPETYDGFVKALHKLGSSGGSGNFPPVAQGGPSNNPASRLYPRPQGPAPEAMDTSNMRLSALSFGSASAPRRAQMTSPAQREARRAQGVCVRCGDPSHWARECPLEPFQPSPSDPALVPANSPAPESTNGEFYHVGWVKDYGPDRSVEDDDDD